MKKSVTRLFAYTALLLFLGAPLMAQESETNDNNHIYIIKRSTDAKGATSVDQTAVEKGEKLKAYLEELNEIEFNGKEVKIEIFDDPDKVSQDGTADEETVFFFRAAKLNASDKEDLEKMTITLNDFEESMAASNVKKKPLLGVYSESGDNGVLITRIVRNSGAQKAGIQKGDIITALDNQAVRTSSDLSRVINEHNIGDQIVVDYIRDGQAAQLTATLGEKQQRNHYRSHYNYNYNYHYNYDYDDYNYDRFAERDPCIVFIGVYTSKTRKGLKIHNIIPNTPADRSDLQVGDYILALDDVDVASHNELVSERDRHEPSDYFTLTVSRDGQLMDIDGQFDACTQEKVQETSEETIQELVFPELPVQKTSNLELESVSVFPNPSFGPINLKFKGAAEPTTIRLIDTAGKVLYEETLNNFDGIYDDTINLNAKPGTLILTIQQKDKVHSESVVLMPRA